MILIFESKMDLVNKKAWRNKVRLLCLMLMGVLAAQDLPNGESRHPEPIKPFELSHYELPQSKIFTGDIVVEFVIDEKGKVTDPVIKDTFNITYNDVVLDKVRKMEFTPPIQNGVPIRVKYKLPIKFK